jgi:hypothetical protein
MFIFFPIFWCPRLLLTGFWSSKLLVIQGQYYESRIFKIEKSKKFVLNTVGTKTIEKIII